MVVENEASNHLLPHGKVINDEMTKSEHRPIATETWNFWQ
jgi:hypothetical protein